MAVQAGKDLLVQVDMTSDGQFETIAGCAPRASVSTQSRSRSRLWTVMVVGASCWQGPVSGRQRSADRACFAMRARMNARGSCSLTG